MKFDEQLILKLLTCPKEIVEAPGKQRLDRGHYRLGFDLQSIDKQFYFSAFGRYNAMFPENFSVGLVFFPKDEKGSYEILRCNGQHGEHMMFPHHNYFHIHKITPVAVNDLMREDCFIETTDKYATFEEALRFFVGYIQLKPNDIQKYFPGRDLQMDLFNR